MSPELIEILTKGGVILLLGFMWWTERQERISERTKNEALAQAVITAMVKTEQTLTTFGTIFTGTKAGPQ